MILQSHIDCSVLLPLPTLPADGGLEERGGLASEDILPSPSVASSAMFRQLLLLCVAATAFATLPNGWKTCSRKDKNYLRCMSEVVSDAIKSLANGDKKLGVLPMDPMKIEKLVIGKGKGPVAFEMTLTNMNNYGLKDIKINVIK